MSDKTPSELALGPSLPPSLADRSNPISVVNLVPGAVGKALEDALFTNPEFFDKDERALWVFLRKDNKQPTPTDNRLRLKFWMEYDNAMAKGARMNLANVV